MNVRNFLSKEQEAAVVRAIKEAELQTSGEIRVHLENHCGDDTLKHARMIFYEMGMQETEEETGVLLYIAVKDHKIAIIGDRGINAKVSENFWENIISELENHFKSEKYAEGICHALQTIGTQLAEHFPFKEDDIDELPNEISFGDDA